MWWCEIWYSILTHFTEAEPGLGLPYKANPFARVGLLEGGAGSGDSTNLRFALVLILPPSLWGGVMESRLPTSHVGTPLETFAERTKENGVSRRVYSKNDPSPLRFLPAASRVCGKIQEEARNALGVIASHVTVVFFVWRKIAQAMKIIFRGVLWLRSTSPSRLWRRLCGTYFLSPEHDGTTHLDQGAAAWPIDFAATGSAAVKVDKEDASLLVVPRTGVSLASRKIAKANDTLSDMYSLGILFFEMCHMLVVGVDDPIAQQLRGRSPCSDSRMNVVYEDEISGSAVPGLGLTELNTVSLPPLFAVKPIQLGIWLPSSPWDIQVYTPAILVLGESVSSSYSPTIYTLPEPIPTPLAYPAVTRRTTDGVHRSGVWTVDPQHDGRTMPLITNHG
ncbi:hypothetical protein GGR50DRAFT_691692 [Xylaria sp. CBS 124048]|nr:hypothetical protein GGR50DRAFT_691692 [Xylaria sp. CBS 124048]